MVDFKLIKSEKHLRKLSEESNIGIAKFPIQYPCFLVHSGKMYSQYLYKSNIDFMKMKLEEKSAKDTK